MEKADYVVIGAGIVGLATAYRLQQKHPTKRILVLEKESTPGHHQSGRNSGVLHTGIYYTPGSLKAENCRDGKKAMEAFCKDHGIAFEVCGKVIVATSEKEIPILHEIRRKGLCNGVKCEVITREELKDREPHAEGLEALWVPEAGIVDYPAVCQKLSALICEHENNAVIYNAPVSALRIEKGTSIVEAGRREPIEADLMINCAGLQSDEMVTLSGQRNLAKIVPFKGEYYMLKESAKHLCRNLIYPVPDPAFPFLGVHFTRMIHGEVECGPNAVLAMGKEAYTSEAGSWGALIKILGYSGARKLFMKHARMGLHEIYRSISKKAFVKALQRLVPEIQMDDVEPAPCGIRAQAVYPDGGMVQDFLIQGGEGMIHVVNAPSPAATSALNIGTLIVDRVEEQED